MFISYRDTPVMLTIPQVAFVVYLREDVLARFNEQVHHSLVVGV
jgi:hypothetical protein